MNNIHYINQNSLNYTLERNAYQASVLTKLNIAKRLIAFGIDNQSIAKITELNINEIDNLKL